jgi:pimeloyl-ACP methyl ester carboxylesterase
MSASGRRADALESERRSYKFVLDQARARRDVPALQRLQRIGPPPRSGGEVWTPRNLLEKYGGAFQKSFVWFEDSGHYPPFEEPQKFNAWMTGTVLPLARSACETS